MTKTTYKTLTIAKGEHDTISITSDVSKITVVFDPFQSAGVVQSLPKADIIFISHDHFDHFSPKDIHAVRNKETIYLFPASILDKVQTFLDVPSSKLIPVVPLEEYKIPVAGMEITCMAVPAYNIDKRSPQGNLFHPKEKEFVGFLLTIDGVSIYFIGDSDPIPEMDALLGMVEVLLLPVSGVYVMTLEEGIALATKLNPALIIPMHYGSIVGDASLGEQFKQQMGEISPNIIVEL